MDSEKNNPSASANDFDKTAIYNNLVKKKLKELLLLCNEYRIPVFVDMAVKNSSAETVYKSEFLSARSFGKNLTNDRLVKHALINSGFSVYPGYNRPDLETALPQYVAENDEIINGIHDVDIDKDS